MSACYMYTHAIVCNNIRLSFVSNFLSMIYIISLSICFPWKKKSPPLNLLIIYSTID